MDVVTGPASNSPQLAEDPTEPRFVVLANRLDAPDFSCALWVSGSAGRGWVRANPIPNLPSGVEKCYGSEVGFDASGTLYYLFVGLAGPGNQPVGAFIATSSDRAQSFSAARPVLGPLNFGVRMAIDPSFGGGGRIHLVWIHATSDPPLGGFGPAPNPILAAHSDDGGQTFTQPVQVSDPSRERVVAPALAVGPQRTVHILYYDLGADARDYHGLEGPRWDGTWSLLLATSTDGGRQYSPGRVVDDAVVPAERVMLIFTMPPASVAADDDRVCVAWTDARHGDADALLRCANRAWRWEPPRRLNDDPSGNGRSQYLPRLSLSPKGRLDAVFFDRRDDPENVRNHVYFTSSSDGGRHFGPTSRITADPSDSRIGQRYINVSAAGQVEFGSRLGLLSRQTGLLAAWPDTRNHRRGTTGQDLFSSEVTVPRPSGAIKLLRSAGLVLVFGSLLIMAMVKVRTRRVKESS